MHFLTDFGTNADIMKHCTINHHYHTLFTQIKVNLKELQTSSPDISEYFLAGLKDGGASIDPSKIKNKRERIRIYITKNYPNRVKNSWNV